MDWDGMARPWLEAAPELEIAFEEVFDTLFAAAALSPGEKVLDVGCGTGPTLIKAANAVGEEGHVLGVDIAPPLLARAAERSPDNVTVELGDAGTYPFEQASFDVILANFGIMFFDDSVAAFKNLRRAVRPGGRLAATVWATPPENPWFSMPRRIVDSIVADVPRPDPTGPGPMRFGDPTALKGYLQEAGWTPSIDTCDVTLLPPGKAAQVARLHKKLTIMRMLDGMVVPDSLLTQIEEAIADENLAFEVDGQMRVPARIHVVTAIVG